MESPHFSQKRTCVCVCVCVCVRGQSVPAASLKEIHKSLFCLSLVFLVYEASFFFFFYIYNLSDNV